MSAPLRLANHVARLANLDAQMAGVFRRIAEQLKEKASD